MHILTRGFSACRNKNSKSRSPKDLHIRKVSFSGSSLSSASDASTVTYTPRTPNSFFVSTKCRSGSVSTTSTCSSSSTAFSYDSSRFSPGGGLAPPRLHERPLKTIEDKERYEAGATFFEDDSSEEELYDEEDDDDTLEDSDSGYELSVKEVLDHHEDSLQFDMLTSMERRGSASSFLTLDITTRPPMPQSRWSASTIQTVQSCSLSRTTSYNETPGLNISDSKDVDEEDEEADESTPVPNFSYKRDTAIVFPTPKRPPMKLADSLEKVAKQGGWKRRGVFFHEAEVDKKSA